MNAEQLKRWIQAPERKGLLTVRGIEIKSELTHGTVQHFLDGKVGLSDENLSKVIRTLKTLKLPLGSVNNLKR